MANFEVSTRTSYRDIGGLVLDCSPFDYEVVDGKVALWRNRARPRAARFGDPQLGRLAASQRPLAVADGSVQFVRASQCTLQVPSIGNFGAASRAWAFAFEFKRGADASNQQAIFGSSDSTALTILRRDGSGNGSVTTSSSSAPGAGDLPSGTSLISFDKVLGTVNWYDDNAAFVSGGSCSSVTFPTNSSTAAYLGTDPSHHWLDGSLYSVRAWNVQLSPLERDLAYKTLRANGSSLAVQSRADVVTRAWRDSTGNPSFRQTDRLRPVAGVPALFHLATLPAVGAARVQFGCELGGVALPDSALAGELFAVAIVEQAAPVVLSSDAGWSSVVDVTFTDPGHYTFLFSQSGHGSRVVHLDVARGA